MNQTQEAARQILGNVSDIQAVVSLCGLTEVSVKLAAIREKASFLYEGDKEANKIMEGYEHDADQAMTLLGEKINEVSILPVCGDDITDSDRLLLLRMSEIFIQRTRVYFDRRTRYQIDLIGG